MPIYSREGKSVCASSASALCNQLGHACTPCNMSAHRCATSCLQITCCMQIPGMQMFVKLKHYIVHICWLS